MIYSEEEKEAIKIFNNYINAIETFGTIDPKCCNNLYEPAIALLDLIENQKAVINLMAEQLTTPINDKKWVIEYYTKLVEEAKYGKTNNNKL